MEQQGPLLIYYNARGTCQIIRSVLLEIGIKYDEVFVDCQGHIPYELTDLGYKFTVKELPYLIHNGLVINEVFPIIKYLCVKYNRVDLLGTSVPDSVLILIKIR
jgi:glutathione S-transferase